MMGHLEHLGSGRDDGERYPVAGLRIAIPLGLALWAAIAAVGVSAYLLG
jgi:hypothetical protein